MQKSARKPYASILSRHDLGDGRMKYIVASSNGIDTYIVISANFIVESCSCPDHRYRHHDCKHMCGVQWYEEDRRVAEQAKKIAAYDVVGAAIEVVAQAESKYELAPNAYESLASTKKCACCGKLYQPDRCQPGRCHWNGWYKPEAA